MIVGIYHSCFVVSDLDHSVDFYTDVLGMKVLRRSESSTSFHVMIGRPNAQIRVAFLESGGRVLELMQFTADSAGAADFQLNHVRATHLALFADDVPNTYRELMARGVKFIAPPTLTRAGRLVAMFHDPDGNALELCQTLPN